VIPTPLINNTPALKFKALSHRAGATPASVKARKYERIIRSRDFNFTWEDHSAARRNVPVMVRIVWHFWVFVKIRPGWHSVRVKVIKNWMERHT